ncbi:addiction module toxin, HicA family protein [Planctomycetales bacterium]|nr:addiction module toxin, HicA family protein [Planctomycetales bacterium]
MTFREVEKMIKNDGWFLVKIRGSHYHDEHAGKTGNVTVPRHAGDLPLRVVNSIRSQAGLK